MQDVVRRKSGIGKIDYLDFFRQFDCQHPAQHGLAAANFTHHLDDPFTTGNGIHHGIENGATISSREKQAGVRGNPEWWLIQTEIFVIHSISPRCYPDVPACYTV